MEHETSCNHRWRYLVNVATRAVRARRCELCGLRSLIAEVRPAANEPAVALRRA